MAEHQLSSLTMRTECFAAEQIEAAARRTGFVKRASKITGKLFLALVTFGAWSDAKTTFAQLATQVTQWDEHVDVSPEAISQPSLCSTLDAGHLSVRTRLAPLPHPCLCHRHTFGGQGREKKTDNRANPAREFMSTTRIRRVCGSCQCLA